MHCSRSFADFIALKENSTGIESKIMFFADDCVCYMYLKFDENANCLWEGAGSTNINARNRA